MSIIKKLSINKLGNLSDISLQQKPIKMTNLAKFTRNYTPKQS